MSINTNPPASLFILEEINLKLKEETMLILNELISLEILDQQSFKAFADFKLELFHELSQISSIKTTAIEQIFMQKENLVFIKKNEYFRFKASIFNLLTNATSQEIIKISSIFNSFEYQRKEHVTHNNSFFIKWELMQKKILQTLKGNFNRLDSITQLVFQSNPTTESSKDLMGSNGIMSITNLLNNVKNIICLSSNEKNKNYSEFKKTIFPIFDLEILKENINNEILLAEIQRLFKDYHENSHPEPEEDELDFSKKIFQNEKEIIFLVIEVFNEKVNLIKKNNSNIDNNTR
ncbi:hypothetical protein [Spiroplasma sp. DGKH1]|uniref:hypothetical protein n=1 Tax=Spiroplasma sp. DGKH1 TaxID=3050074 RepID=UPI0034C6B72A